MSDATGAGLRVALAFNLKRVPLSESDAEAEFDPPQTIDVIAGSIEALGHEVVRTEADRRFPQRLADADPDVVFNIAEAVGGRAREAYVPAVCEMMGYAYTGADPTTLAVALDKALAKMVLSQAGAPTPAFKLVKRTADLDGLTLRFPLIVKPNEEGSSKGLGPANIAESSAALHAAVERLLTDYAQAVIIEECVMGREFTVGFLGTDEPEALPLLEFVYLDASRPPIYDIELKQDPPDKIRHDCPADVDGALRDAVVDVARRAYRALACRDIGRVDVRLDSAGRPYVLEVNPLPGLAPRYSDVCKMTESLGWPHTELIDRILQPAIARAQ